MSKLKWMPVPLVAIAVIAITDDAISAEWDFKPSIAISETYDDNVFLANENEAQDDIVTQVNPRFSLVGKGRYSEFLFDYTMQNVFYQKNNEHDTTFHNIKAANKTELVHDHLFLEIDGNYSQREINRTQRSSTDNIGITDNRTDVATYSVKPYFVHNFSQSAIFTAQYTYTETDNKSDDLAASDNQTNTSYFELKSGPSSRFDWRISHQNQMVDYDNRADVKSSRSELQIKYPFSRKLYFVGIGGYEEYDYVTRPGQDDPAGSFWEAGLGWMPSNRTLFELRKGEHYFGETKSVLINHKTRRSSWALNYSEQINTTSISVPQLQPEEPGSDTYNIIPAEVAVVSLNKLLTFTVTKNTAKSTLRLSVIDSKRVYQELSGEERYSTAIAAWDWQAGRRISFRLQEQYSKSSLSETDSEVTTRQHEAGIDYKLNQKTNAYFRYNNIKQESQAQGILYRRNTYTLGVSMSF